MTKLALLVSTLLAGCVADEPDMLDTTGRIAANGLDDGVLAANKAAIQPLGAAKLAASPLLATADGRTVMSYLVGCALPASARITLSGYTFTGDVGLAPTWTTNALTTSQQRWVTACMLARVNYFGTHVSISMRGDNAALATTLTETLGYAIPESAFYGNLFIAGQPEYACIALLKELNVGSTELGLRDCAVPSSGSTTLCGFAYTGQCGLADNLLSPACKGIGLLVAPYTDCYAGTSRTIATYHEVITVELSTL